MIDTADTIVAIASPTAPALRGVVRVSGDHTAQLLRRLGCCPSNGPAPRRLETEIELGGPLGKISVDLLFWPTRRSYSGQPSAEIHTTGSLPVLSAIVDALVAAGGRVARPGEFTLRAFLAGRLDLTQAEAVLGVIDAESQASLQYALDQLAGNLGRPLNQLRSELLDLMADVEAGLDFVDEEIEFIGDAELAGRLTSIQHRLSETADRLQHRGGGAARPVIALRGEPNAGKSSLLNCLAGHEAAIVADVAGTTRDAVQTEASIDGQSVLLVDTAGIEAAQDSISLAAQRQAERTASQASLRLWCVDFSRSDLPQAIAACEAMILQAADSRPVDLRIATKSDLSGHRSVPPPWIAVSATSGHGLDDLRAQIAAMLAVPVTDEFISVVGTAARAGESIRNARTAVAQAIEWTEHQSGHEFVAAELRVAAAALGEVTGEVFTDDILDRVFSRFCIGK